MAFSSIPTYLDPANWQQHQNNHGIGSSSANPIPPPHGGGGSGSIRPGSMAERARMANIPMPETASKCPRCESLNTKFCYFNNYSLSQPRHFCKTCRRYWTRGGALRSVPVGGGCRRNKRSKSTSSNSPASGDCRRTPSSSTSATISTNGVPAADNILASFAPQLPPLRFMPHLDQLTDNFNPHDGVGLNYSGSVYTPSVLETSEMSFHSRSSLFAGGGGNGRLGGCIEPWRLHPVQQFPFLGSIEPSSSGTYRFQSGETGLVGGSGGQTSHLVRPKLSSMMLNQMAPVKLEENRELNLSRQLMGTLPRNDHWNSTWITDLSNLGSFSTSNPL